MTDVIQRTWEELGYKVRPLRWLVFVRTEPLHKRTEGGVWLPPKQGEFYSGMAHQRVFKGMVCSVGPKATVKAGSRICFQRLYFVRCKRLEDGTYAGWIDTNHILGYPEDDEAEERWLQGGEAPVAPDVASEYTL